MLNSLFENGCRDIVSRALVLGEIRKGSFRIGIAQIYSVSTFLRSSFTIYMPEASFDFLGGVL